MKRAADFLPVDAAYSRSMAIAVIAFTVKVWYSRWVAMDATGRVFEGAGIAPDIEIAAGVNDHQQRDVTLRRGIEILRQRLSEAR